MSPDRPGDALVVFALWLWLTIRVGPVWVGLVAMACGAALNLWWRTRT